MTPAEALRRAKRLTLSEARSSLPATPGTYAWWAAPQCARRLGLTTTGAGTPLYVGKAARLADRVLAYALPQRRGRTEFRDEFRQALVQGGSLPPSEVEIFGADVFDDEPLFLALDRAVGEILETETRVSWVEAPNTSEAGVQERAAIREMNPLFNYAHVDESNRYESQEWLAATFDVDHARSRTARTIALEWACHLGGQLATLPQRGRDVVELVAFADDLEPGYLHSVRAGQPSPDDPERVYHRFRLIDLRLDDEAVLEVLAPGAGWPPGIIHPIEGDLLRLVGAPERHAVALYHEGLRFFLQRREDATRPN